MRQTHCLRLALCLSFFTVLNRLPAQNAPAEDLRQQLQLLQQQIQQMRQEHSAAMHRMQAEIQELKARATQAPAAAAAAVPAVVAGQNTARLLQPGAGDPAPAGDSRAEDLLERFIQQHAAPVLPAKVADSLSLDASVVIDAYYHRDGSREGISHLKEHISGFGHHHHGHEHGVIENGFNLRHIELGLSAAVDPYFTAWTTLAFEHQEGVEVEEAVVQTTSLPWNLTLAAGRFMSGIGRLNRQHSHNWDFIDTPLVYEKLFGGHGVTETGLQLTWLAPTPFYMLFGVEAANGENELLSNSIGGEELPEHDGPRLWTAFMKVSPNLGPRHDLQLGLSWLKARNQEQHDEDEDELPDLWLDGSSQVYGADFVYKYNAQKAHGHGDFTLQAEYFQRKKSLQVENSLLASDLTGHHRLDWQDGYYLQAAYGILPRWRLGLRWEEVGIRNDSSFPDGQNADFGASNRATAMLDWKLSEFSLLRLQTGRSNYHTEEGRQKAWELGLQIQISIGEHKAHDF
ncbi:MAG: zinc-regulated TonB-dependent outer membrane receptor [Oligosphaeraceae bacterium]|nr:zinc-regulated TonB-dependent outer membrane receptor [Oligosphaeraceae bacterium]